MERQGKTREGMEWHGMGRHAMVRKGMAWEGKALHGMERTHMACKGNAFLIISFTCISMPWHDMPCLVLCHEYY
jgi:hypothetical protein